MNENPKQVPKTAFQEDLDPSKASIGDLLSFLSFRQSGALTGKLVLEARPGSRNSGSRGSSPASSASKNLFPDLNLSPNLDETAQRLLSIFENPAWVTKSLVLCIAHCKCTNCGSSWTHTEGLMLLQVHARQENTRRLIRLDDPEAQVFIRGLPRNTQEQTYTLTDCHNCWTLKE